MAEGIISLKTVSAEPTTVGRITVTPQSQMFSLRLPFARVVWHRPVGVLVEQDGQAEQIRVLDLTRLVQLGLLATIVVAAVVASARTTRREGAEV